LTNASLTAILFSSIFNLGNSGQRCRQVRKSRVVGNRYAAGSEVISPSALLMPSWNNDVDDSGKEGATARPVHGKRQRDTKSYGNASREGAYVEQTMGPVMRVLQAYIR
jgi:hypothetical protein